MTIPWTVDDGYRNHGQHETEISDDELLETGSKEEAMTLIHERVQAAFMEKCVPAIQPSVGVIETAVVQLFAKLAKEEGGKELTE